MQSTMLFKELPARSVDRTLFCSIPQLGTDTGQSICLDRLPCSKLLTQSSSQRKTMLNGRMQSHNISANQIRQDANARRAAALASQQAADGGDNAAADENDNSTSSPSAEAVPMRRKKETKAQSEKRKKEEEVGRIPSFFYRQSLTRLTESYRQNQSFQEIQTPESPYMRLG
jgi:DNA repair protein RAD7